MKTLTKEEFVYRAKLIHGDKYNYDKVVYINNYTPVEIFCKKCNEYFFQKPSSHLRGFGCKKCGYKEMWNKRHKMTQEEFIEKVKKIHNDNYDYSKVEYNKITDKVTIICKKCGKEFSQKAYVHLRGQGCPICRKRNNK